MQAPITLLQPPWVILEIDCALPSQCSRMGLKTGGPVSVHTHKIDPISLFHQVYIQLIN